MDEIPQASVDKDTVFRTEKGLETYSYSFYNMLPSVAEWVPAGCDVRLWGGDQLRQLYP